VAFVSTKNHLVTIKGVKDGLVFLIDEDCEFADVLTELQTKLGDSFGKFVEDTALEVTVKLGKRQLTLLEKESLQTIITSRGNLTVKSIESDPLYDVQWFERLKLSNLTLHKGTVRSGQVLEHDGNLLHVGDVNPGGAIVCSGDIYILGALRGMAHAGSQGNEESVVAASLMKPTQLRIAGVISRPPDEWVADESYMEFAFLQDGQMKVDKISNYHKAR
jgi:septum site-determining protein MinC